MMCRTTVHSASAPASPIRELELRRLLRRFLDVCNTIEYAHSRGVLHRDLKPANIIVGKYGETLVVDWGLAKPLGRVEPGQHGGEEVLVVSSASGSAETLPGSTLGTPAYMSPEQAEGKLDLLGPRSDVYSLGATLYCLLTGTPPFAGKTSEIIDAVRLGRFPPPRQLEANIDPALEAICLKAMAHRPDDRYDSCRALADDLDRWMADEPVTAWREPFLRRAGRWARRHKSAMTGGIAALLAGYRRPLHRAGCPDPRQHRADTIAGRRGSPLRPGRRGDPDLSHGRQRRLSAQAGPVQERPRPALEIGQRLLRQARSLAGQRVGPRFTAGLGECQLRSGRADGQGRQPRGLRSKRTGKSWSLDGTWRPKLPTTPTCRPTWHAA